MADSDEIARLYGRWCYRSPRDASEMMRGYARPWWVSGGWAIETFTGVSRAHDDLDISIARHDLQEFCDHIGGRLDIWAADNGSLTPVSMHPGAVESPTCSNLWLRASGSAPWEYDIMLVDLELSTWTYKHDARIARQIDEALCTKDGIRYLRAELQLLHKARGLRDKDSHDFDTAAPLLGATEREWLAWALGIAYPGHPWIDRLSAQSEP